MGGDQTAELRLRLTSDSSSRGGSSGTGGGSRGSTYGPHTVIIMTLTLLCTQIAHVLPLTWVHQTTVAWTSWNCSEEMLEGRAPVLVIQVPNTLHTAAYCCREHRPLLPWRPSVSWKTLPSLEWTSIKERPVTQHAVPGLYHGSPC